MSTNPEVRHHPKLKDFVEPWLYKRAIKLFGKERLEKWKDAIAAYWEKNLENLDEAQLLVVLSRMYGRKEGKKLLRGSRTYKTQMILRGEEQYLIGRFAKKLEKITHGEDDKFTAQNLKLEEHDYSHATITHEGDTYDVKVDGIIAITGSVTAHHADGSKTTAQIFSRWVTHPFWQYAHQSIYTEKENGND